MPRKGNPDPEREMLERRYAESSAAFDKALLTLAAGALGVSLVFVRDVAPAPLSGVWFLRFAWACFGLSLVAILAALYCSQFALLRTIAQHDADMLNAEVAGGRWTAATAGAELLAFLSFVLGVALLVGVAGANFGGVRNEQAEHGNAEARGPTADSAAAPAGPDAATGRGPAAQ